MQIDLNCDLGESFGAWQMGADEKILPFVTSANIACGFHAGDPGVMRRTVQAALRHGVAIGAHPGLPDLAGFGRRAMAVTPEEVFDLVLYQIGALAAIARAEGGRVAHVKAHGALYNMAAKDEHLARAIADAARRFDETLVLFGLAGSVMLMAGKAAGLRTAAEGFADRTYQPDGTLTPRSRPDALISDPPAAADQALRIGREGRVQTICVHGDGPHAPEIVRAVRQRLESSGLTVKAP